MEKHSLLPREWIALITVFFLLTVLTLLSFRTTKQELDFQHPHYLTNHSVEIVLKGAFSKPGKVTVAMGMTVGDVLKEHPLLSEADSSRLNLSKKIRNNSVIDVPFKKRIVVHLTGAMTATLSLPQRTSRLDLMPLLLPFQEIDLTSLLKKQRLKNGETISLPALIK